jgi:Arc/MetJ-type ribon-helix-helix transcriptional regulator
MSGKEYTVSIPEDVYKKIEGRVEGAGFNSVSEYVTYVLKEVLASLEEDSEEEQVFTEEEEEKVKERLRALGYID